MSNPRPPLLRTLAFTLGLGTSACSPTETEVTLQAESWGAFEHTHADFVSITASKPCPSEGPGVTYVDPMPKLVELARDQQIVMINEAHYKPIHRAFIGELAKALKADGFTHFGAEAFDPAVFSDQNRNVELSKRGYPTLTDGTSYISEPVFGQLIETVIQTGYTLFAYENTLPLPKSAVSQIAHRDTAQAKNILAELDNASDIKILVHAGYHHVREVEGVSGEKWMAQFFQEQSGINPLTISQTDCYSETVFRGGTFGYALPVDQDGNPITSNGYDVVIIPPKEVQYNGRPTWLREIGRDFVELPSQLKFEDQYTRVTAYDLRKVQAAVVEDTIYRPPHSDKPLSLRIGRYRLEVTDKDKRMIASTEINVP